MKINFCREACYTDFQFGMKLKGNLEINVLAFIAIHTVVHVQISNINIQSSAACAMRPGFFREFSLVFIYIYK